MTDYKVIAGLGNPGRRYAFTRHNLGFITLDELQRQLYLEGAADSWRKLEDLEIAQGRLGGHKVWLLKPLSYMNRSGVSLVRLLRFHKIPIQSLIVIHDDLDLDFGRLRLKHGGGHGGHNGLRSITNCSGSDDFARVRLGIGRPDAPEQQMDMADWVLSQFSQSELVELDSFKGRAIDAVRTLIDKGLQTAQNLYN